jgi:RNA polymerase sigma-70 factor (ECF subfamily)
MTPSDSALVRQAISGTAVAFDELASRHRPRLVREIAALIGDADEAESLAQEALALAYAQLADFRAEAPFAAWLHGIGRNLSRHHLRARGHHARAVAPEQLAGLPAAKGRRRGVLSDILRREEAARARAAIAALPAPLRDAFVMHFIEGRDYAAMSHATGVSAGTLRVRAHRARTLLRNALGAVVDTWLH